MMHSYAEIPRANIPRSVFPLSEKNTFTFNEGELIPFVCMEVLPSSTFEANVSAFVRSQTPITPVMDDAYLDIQFYFTPSRLVWEHWVNLMGENTASHWAPSVEYETPYLTSPSGGFDKDSIADYLGIPTGVAGLEVNALPFRAYSLVYNEWFRDQNLIDPAVVTTGDTNYTGVKRSSGNPLANAEKGGAPFRAAKLHDYFTSCLPSPQKATDPVTVPLGGVYPVEGPFVMSSYADLNSFSKYAAPFNGTIQQEGHGIVSYRLASETYLDPDRDNPGMVFPAPDAKYTSGDPIPLTSRPHVNLASADSSLTINALREAFALQRLYERDARGGSRYTELLLSHFGAVSPDGRLQRPEYLGGKRMRINMQQVVQSSETSGTPLGTTAAYSCTQDKDYYFTKSFTEHGYILGLAVVRVKHTYQQGLHRMWSRKGRFDYYWPVFAGIGEQPVKNREIYATGTASGSRDDENFGFMPAWEEYRSGTSRVSGEMRSNVTGSLDIWHYGDDYDSLPTLGSTWIEESSANIDRTLAVKSTTADQFFGQILVYGKKVLPMPVYGVPGMLDHN